MTNQQGSFEPGFHEAIAGPIALPRVLAPGDMIGSVTESVGRTMEGIPLQARLARACAVGFANYTVLTPLGEAVREAPRLVRFGRRFVSGLANYAVAEALGDATLAR